MRGLDSCDTADTQPPKRHDGTASFWEHLDVMRWMILRCIIVVAVLAVAMFMVRDELFSIILAPSHHGFITFRLLGTPDFQLHLMNTMLTEQFYVHVKMAVYAALLTASPYLLCEIFMFLLPAMYADERRYAFPAVIGAYSMFALGTLVNYFLVFPCTLHFLGTYQVSPDIHNMLTLQSYMDTLLMMSLVFGIIFEIPVISWLLARFGLLRAEWMTQYRRHAIVAILVLAAVITPTADAFTLLIVSLPIWMLYEVSVVVVRRVGNRQKAIGKS